MSYEKHTWETGETITAEKLNNLEDGVAFGGGSVFGTISKINDKYQADMTFKEIYTAIESGKMVYVKIPNYDSDYEYFTCCPIQDLYRNVSGNDYGVSFINAPFSFLYCTDEDEYPTEQ